MVELGRVTSVVPKPAEKRVYVSVKTSPSETFEEILFATGMAGLWMMPSEGDIVEVYEIGKNTYHARTPHNPTPLSMPDMGEGDFCLRLNAGTELFFSQQDDGTFDLSITADGTVDVTAPEVNVGSDGGTPKPVAREGDPVSGSTSDGATFDGQIDSGSSDVNST